MKSPTLNSHQGGMISRALHNLLAQIPGSNEPIADDPHARAHELAKIAALKAAAVSGSFSLPFGPLGLATVLPDLLGLWRIQQQLVADIAAAFGKTPALTREAMIVSLFQHGSAAITRGLLARAGDDVVVARIANRTLQQLLEKIAIRLAQRLAAKSVSRWIPIVGALGAGAYAYYDTTHVANNAIELFSKRIRLGYKTSEPPASLAAGKTKGRNHTRRQAKARQPTQAAAPRLPRPRAGSAAVARAKPSRRQ